MAEETKPKQNSIIQHFEKSPDYRTILATGVYGGMTINGMLCINIITDIPPIPITTESENKENQLVQTKVDFNNKVAIREVQCGVMMNIETAKLIQNWLSQNIKLLEDAIRQSTK